MIKQIGILILLFPTLLFGKNKEIVLSKNWKIKTLNAQEWIVATKPMDIYSILLEAGKIEDPYKNYNLEKVKHYSDSTWIYQTTFQLNDQDLNKKKAVLELGRLDVYADIYLNGKLLDSTANAFRTYTYDCTSLLRSGLNELLLVFHPTLSTTEKMFGNRKPILPADNHPLSPWIRKSATEFGWDISGGLLFTGIRKAPVLHLFNEFRVTSARYIIKKFESQRAIIDLEIEVDAEIEGQATLIWNCTNMPISIERTIDLKKGKQKIITTWDQVHPRLWWTHDMGEPFLYQFNYSLKKEDEVKGQLAVGIRSVELVREKDTIGESFFFRLNGRPLYIRGANHVPVNRDLLSVQKVIDCCGGGFDKNLMDAAVDLNMNMIRIWGGGEYESDEFYELADQYGILIWQDLMFANTIYPPDTSFEEEIRKEIKEIAERIGHHPCIALWCGNNEIDVAWKNWGWQDKLKYSKEEQSELFQHHFNLEANLIPSVLNETLGSINYLMSSPISNWGKFEDFNFGDNHDWSVWHGESPFSAYEKRVPRFMSEFGFPSLPTKKTWQKFSDEESILIDSLSDFRMKSYKGNTLIEKYLFEYFIFLNFIKDPTKASQWTQMEALRIGINAQRSNSERCSGTLIWQLNDHWPGITWSLLDYGLEKKSAWYETKRRFKTVATGFSRNEKGAPYYFVSNDSMMNFIGETVLTFHDLSGKQLSEERRSIEIKNNSVCKFDFTYSSEGVYTIQLFQNGVLISEDHFWTKFPSKHEYRRKVPIKRKTTIIDNNTIRIQFSAKKPVQHFSLESHKASAFSDNYFDLIPGQKKSVTIKMKEPANKKEMKAISKEIRYSYY